MTWVFAAYAGLGSAGLYLAAGGLLFLFQARLVFHPLAGLEADPSDAGLAFDDLRLALPQGGDAHAWYVPGAVGGELAGLGVLFCHGNGGNISHRLETLRFLHELGCNTLIFDYPGYGRSSGAPTEQGCHAAARAAWDFLMARGVDPRSVVAWGRSLGGAVAARLAADVTPGALVVESSFTSVAAMGARLYPVFPRPVLRLLCTHRFETERDIARARCPVLVIHSPLDETVPFDMGQRLHEIAPEPKAFLEITGGHNEGWQLSGQAYMHGVREFLAPMVA